MARKNIKENYMKKLFLLFILAIIFVSCTNNAAEENARTSDTTNFTTNDTPLSPNNSATPAPLPNAETPAAAEVEITLEKAKEIAFEDAGLTEDKVYALKTDFDSEGQRQYYEIDFKSGNYEYEYEIDAKNGKILKKDKEID